MFSTSFEHNKAESEGKGKRGFGGVFYVTRPKTDMVIQNCTFHSNIAENEGHDMYLRKVSKLRMANCVLASELTSKSNSLWTRDVVSLDVWNTSFRTRNSSLVNINNLRKPQNLAHVAENWNGVTGNWSREVQNWTGSWVIFETPYASGNYVNFIAHCLEQFAAMDPRETPGMRPGQSFFLLMQFSRKIGTQGVGVPQSEKSWIHH